MQVINWPELQPLPADLETLRTRLQEALPLQSVYQSLVEVTLRAYPWAGRNDLVPCYHPSKTYQQGQKLALPIPDPEHTHRTVWLAGQVKEATFVQNPVQGRFQVLTLDIQSRQIRMVAALPDANYPEPDLSQYSAEDLNWLTQWSLDTYAAALETTLKKLIHNRQICGSIAGETFLPENVSAISLELLDPIFARLTLARPWISLEGIFRDLPDLSQLERERILTMLRAALKGSPYRSLGGDRWTTPELFRQIDREVLGGIPAPLIRPRESMRKKRDEQELDDSASQFLPREAREALEELGLGEERSLPETVPWRPPQTPLPLPALSYLQVVQAYIPVRGALRAFAPDHPMVFVQFIDGEHQPFLLDREAGLLKAIYPTKFRAQILEHGLAGTDLWLEFEGEERYRIAPRPLSFKRMVPCKLAYLDHGQLHIKHTQISMKHEGRSSLFKADMRAEDIEALLDEANRLNRNLRETMIASLQEICATDPDHRAHWRDLFNLVSLQQMYSPRSLAFLLYTQPCFESLGGGYFRYKDVPVTVKKVRKQNDRLSRMWDDFLADPVAARPVRKERTAIGAYSQLPPVGSPAFAPVPEISVATWSYGVLENDAALTIAVDREGRMEPILLHEEERESSTPAAEAVEPVGHPWKERLERSLRSLAELESTNASPASENQAADPASPEDEESFEMPIEMAHVEALSLSSPFRWEPRPAWLTPPAQPISPSTQTFDSRRWIYRPNGLLRPLHKQRFYQRFFFYLRRWLSRGFQK